MARATDKLVFLTRGQLIVGAFGIILLIITMKLTRDATKAATQQATAAVNANRLTENMGKAQVKAYMSVSECFVHIEQDGVPVVEFKYRNIGQSPARGTMIDVFVGTTTKRNLLDVGVMDGQREWVGDCIPGNDYKWDGRLADHALNEEQLEQFITRASAIHVAITVSFRDVFRDQQSEPFAFWIPFKPGEIPRNPFQMTPLPGGFRAQIIKDDKAKPST